MYWNYINIYLWFIWKIWNLKVLFCITRLCEKDAIVSAAISKNDNFLAVNTGYKNPEIHIWCLKKYEII